MGRYLDQQINKSVIKHQSVTHINAVEVETKKNIKKLNMISVYKL